VQSILAFIRQLISICFQSLQHRFVDWTRPSNTSLTLGTVADLARTKSELMAENAFLRKPLIVLRRQVKRPACAKKDRVLLVLLARMVRTWKQALFIVQEDGASALASTGISAVLEVQIQSSIF
jgi:putative transposase